MISGWKPCQGKLFVVSSILYFVAHFYFCKLFMKVSSQSIKVFENQIPIMFNLARFHSISKCGMYLTSELRLIPSLIALVLPAFKKSLNLFPVINRYHGFFKINEFLSPFNIMSVSSAYWKISFPLLQYR